MQHSDDDRSDKQTFSIEDLEQETGLDRRRIAYYRQRELLPLVGRLGPKTRYPRRFLDRLLFIKKIQGMREEGRAPDLTLDELKSLMDHIGDEMVGKIASGEEDLKIAWQWAEASRAPPGPRGRRKDDDQEVVAADEMSLDALPGRPRESESLGDQFRQLQEAIKLNKSARSTSGEEWSEYRLGADVRVSFRSLPDEEKESADRFVRRLQKALLRKGEL